MAITTKTYDQVVADIILKVQTDLAGVITDFNPGSVVRTLIEAFSLQIGMNDIVPINLYQELEDIYNGAYVDTATGDDLDKIAALVGTSRVPAVYATGSVRFYAEPAPIADIIIPAGTQVGTQPTAAETQIIYQTDAQVILLASTTFIDATITASVAGVASNVAANKLTYLATPIYGITSVTNSAGITGGRDAETDVVFRIRIKAAVIVAGKATSDSLKYAVLGITGVGSVTVNDLPIRDIVNEQHIYTTGTTDYTLYQADVINEPTMVVTGTVSSSPYTFVKGTDFDMRTTLNNSNDIYWILTGTLPDTGTMFEVDYRVNKLGEVDMIIAGTTIPMPGPVLADVVAIIDSTKAAGVKVNVVEPAVITQNVTVTISVLPGYSAVDVKNLVKANITAYLDTIAVGYDVLRADIFTVCQDTEGVYNTTITTPATDVAISSVQVARPGTITVN